MAYKYVLWDLDGTLTNPEEGITKCVQYALESFGIQVENRVELRPFIGPPLTESFKMFYQFPEEKARQAVEKYRERYKTIGIFENFVYEGIENLLKNLHNKGIKIALATSKPQIFGEQILEKYGLRPYFDYICGSELDGTRVEKDEIIAFLLDQFGEVNHEEIIMIGDRKYDVMGAKKFGIETIGVSYGFAEDGELQAAGAKIVVDTVEQLGNILLAD